jgi:hypothetical protein
LLDIAITLSGAHLNIGKKRSHTSTSLIDVSRSRTYERIIHHFCDME